MNAEHQSLERHIKKSSLVSNTVSLAIALITAMSVGYGFYFKTNANLNTHTNDIMEVKREVKQINTKINNNEVFKGVSSEKFKEIEQKVDKMDEKLDRILIQTNR
jgi:predicted RND superfamily exporter protein